MSKLQREGRPDEYEYVYAATAATAAGQDPDSPSNSSTRCAQKISPHPVRRGGYTGGSSSYCKPAFCAIMLWGIYKICGHRQRSLRLASDSRQCSSTVTATRPTRGQPVAMTRLVINATVVQNLDDEQRGMTRSHSFKCLWLQDCMNVSNHSTRDHHIRDA